MAKLKPASLRWALNQALNVGDSDIFPETFEYQAIKDHWADVEAWLSKEDILNWNIRPPLRCLTPKHRYGFRISTQLDPVDFLMFTALVYEIGKDLESKRVPSADKIVHSYRFAPQPDGEMYDRAYGYDSFWLRSKELADTGAKWAVVADIADFFPRLYHHRLKNALSSSTAKTEHVTAIDRMLSGWNESYSYGIPVGCQASRLLAEIALDDVDRALLSEGASYVRFSDDFRVFCDNKRQAYERLAFLADVLFENHGLTLQQHKTQIMPIDAFVRRYLSTAKDEEVATLSERFREILVEELDLGDPYENVEWDDLTDEQQEKISELNLVGILEEQAKLDELDITLTRFVLRRLAQVGSTDALDTVLENMDNLYPVTPQVVLYIRALRNLSEDTKEEIGGKLLSLLDDSVVSHCEFHRMWLLSAFTHDHEFDHEDRFASVYSAWPDQLTQRQAILALGKSHQDTWFRTHKRRVFDFAPWTRRALLAAGSCLPSDERKHWYQSLERRLDPLEVVIMKWARKNPF